MSNRLKSRRRGSAMVEFAIGSGVLVAAFAGTFQFGYTFFQYNQLQTAVAQAARFAALLPYDSPTAAPSSAFLAAVQNMVLYGSPTQGSSPILSGLTAGNVNLAVTFTNGAPAAMTVSINGYAIYSVFGTAILSNKPRVTCAYQGIWSPV